MTIDELYALLECDKDSLAPVDQNKLSCQTQKFGQRGVFEVLEHLDPKFEPVACTAHDQIYIGANETVAKNATRADIVLLRNLGVFLDEDSLSMFV